MNREREHVSSENMDILEVSLQNRLDQYRDSHPNLVKLWKEYIKVKRISYLKSIVDCESMILNQPSLMILFFVFSDNIK